MNMATNGTVPAPADQGSSNAVQNNAPGDLAAISPMFAKLQAMGTDSTNEEDNVPAPGDSRNNDDDVPANLDDDGNVNDDNDDGIPSDDGDDAGDDDSTKGGLPTDDDIDWAYKVPVKIDGKVEYFTLEQLRKGYATEQSLSAKGRELGDQRKQLDAERNEKLKEIIDLGSTLHAQMEAGEKQLSSQYHEIKAQMEKAIEDGDGYEAKELKAKLTQVQKAYWEAKESKDGLSEKISAQIAAEQERAMQENLKYFNDNIHKAVPGFDQKMAVSVREFALKEGLPEGLLEQVFDPNIIKFINDYRVLKEKSVTGAAKRKDAPTRTVPLKKGTPQKDRDQKSNADLRSKVLSGEGGEKDQLAFLRGISRIGSKL